MKATGFWAAARNAALKVVAFWVLVFAAYLAIGRQFFPYIDRLKPEFETWLSYQLGTTVEIGQMRGEWERFNPVLYLTDVRLGDALTVQGITLAPGIYESISRGGLSFIRFELVDFSAQLIETSDGWRMTGLAQNNNASKPVDLQSLLNLLRRQEEVTFTRTQLAIEPLNLPAFDLTLEEGRLNGYGGENGLVATATLTANSVAIPIELQIETTANATGLNRVYFRHGEIDLAPWTQNVVQQISESTIAGEYWLTLQGEQWQHMTARLSSPRFVFHGQYSDIVVADAKVEAYVENKGNGQESWLNVLGYSLNGKTFDSTQAKLTSRAGRVKLEWDSLPADLVGHWLALNDPNGFWQGVQPTGFIEQGYLTFQESNPASLIAQAKVTDFSLQPHQAVPGLNQLNGRIRVEGDAGKLELSSLQSQLQLSNLYTAPFNVRVDSASLEWRLMPNSGLYSHGMSNFTLLPNANGAIETDAPVSVHWRTVNPVVAQKSLGRESTLELSLTAESLSKEWAIDLVNNKAVDSSVSDLLAQRLQKGDFSHFRLDYLTSAGRNQPSNGQIFIHSQFDGVQLTFLDDWEAVSALSGHLALDKHGLQVAGVNGKYPGFDLNQVTMNLDFQQNRMQVNVDGQASASNGLTFLQTGPLRPQYGDVFDSWKAQGDLQLQAKVSIPLATPNQLVAQVAVTLDDNSLNLTDLDLQLSSVTGQVSYDSQRGLSSTGLNAKHLGLPQAIRLSGANETQNKVRLDIAGQTPVRYWGERFSDAFLASQSAIIGHDTQVDILPTKVTIRTQSDLLGLELPFPEPLLKTKDQLKMLSLAIDLDERNWTLVRANLGESLQSFFELNQDNAIQRGAVAINSSLNVRKENGVFFDIVVEQSNGDDWWQSIQQLRRLYASLPLQEGEPSFESLIKSIQIKATELTYLAQPWSQVSANLLRNENAWIISFNADEGQGQVLVPHDDEPIFAQMNWLRLITGEEDIAFADETDPLLDYLPSDVPAMQMQISKLIWNDRDMGSWRTEISINNEQLHANNIVGELNGATVNGTLIWAVNNKRHQSKFNGTITVGNLLDVLTTWGYAPVLTSRSGLVAVDAFWQGSPAFFDFKRLQGSIDLSLRKGAILQVEEYEGIKLIGLLNFTRVIQRIALDFSDLLQAGITYDSIEGELLFDRGFARVGEKLVIDGSATKFKFSGDADLLSDELDIDMVLTVPLSSTFPLVALLAGVTPQAAAAIYVTERVFNNELERLSSARMHITGSFEAPETKFYKVFDSSLGEKPPTVTDRFVDVIPEGVINP